MVFSKVKWGCTTTEAINSENLTKINNAIDFTCEKPVQEVKIKPKTCINCCAPLHSNVCEYCGTVYDVENKSDGVMRNALLGSGISAEEAIEIFSCGGCI